MALTIQRSPSSRILGTSATKRRNGRVVECDGLENRFPPSGGTGVRIPLSPHRQIIPSASAGGFVFPDDESGAA